jgi:beta-glucanase (GH16 family)
MVVSAICALLCLNPTARADPPPGTGTWTLQFADEFDGTSLDTSKWRLCLRDGYCDPPAEQEHYDASGVIVGGSRVTLRATPRAGGGYTSGAINTASTFQFTYGYAEMRATLPNGRGLWPAFWLFAPEGVYGEIDIFDGLLQLPRQVRQGIVYWQNGVRYDPHRDYIGVDLSNGLHTFGVLWAPGTATFYIDGVYQTKILAGVPAKPLWLIANLAVDDVGYGPPDPASWVSADFSIDYIKVWQHCPSCDDGNACTTDT